MASVEFAPWAPQSQADKDAVLAQLDRLVSHPSLKSSKRCPALLRYIVEHQLSGETHKLKERMIGIAVFGRDSDYDSNADPVVRTTANDLRKRLAQYYHEPGHEHDLRIALPLGSYVPEFRVPGAPHPENGSTSPIAVSIQPLAPASAIRARSGETAWSHYLISACLLVALIISIVWRQPASEPRSLIDFWGPVAKSSPVLLCIGTWNVSSVTAEGPPTPAASLNAQDLLPMTDAIAFSRVTAFLGEARVSFRVENAKSTTLTDLTEGPVVLIGAIDNQWTMRITDPLRFHFVQRDGRPHWTIGDRKNDDHVFLNVSGESPDGSKDYAIIGRLSNGTSGQMSVVVAGLGAAGTTAASEFVTDSRYMDYLSQQVPKGFKTKNLEAVISVQVVDSRPGAPHIEAVETW